MLGLAVYKWHLIAPNRISPEQAKNSTALKETSDLMFNFDRKQFGQTKSCYRLPPEKRLCIVLRAWIELIRMWFESYYRVVRHVFPENAEDLLYLLHMGSKKFQEAGIVKYFLG